MPFARYACDVLKAYQAWYDRHKPSVESLVENDSDSDYDALEADPWADAELESVAELVRESLTKAFH